ncbi:MAG: hypothetical protein J6N53_10630 [Lachnospiraceae bacterium]|nr:hypothetical protein [Lachnospiraceae bacterium]
MTTCPECGGELRFDITTQSLRCPFCDQKKDPQRFTGYNVNAEESRPGDPSAEETDMILYTCPQCGGSIYSTEHSINGFCSYCGSYVMLESRFVKMKHPKYIVPFRITKEQCIEEYKNYVKKALFAPSELKEQARLDNFRGIYISYWGYDVTMEGFMYLDGKRNGRHYKCMGWMNAVFNNIFFDASSMFEDRYSEQIAPFNYGAKAEFNPAYLSGFYADMPDLPDDVYLEEALEIAKDKAYQSSRLNRAFPDMYFDSEQEEKFHAAMDTRCSASYTTFFPVWFLSWQKNNSVSYAVVNGQTGRVAGDLPVDSKKFILSGCLIAIPLLLLLYVLPPFSKAGLLITGETFSLFSVLLLMFMIRKVIIRNEMLYDKGYLSKNDMLNYKYRLKVNADRRLEEAKKKGLIPLVIVALLVGIPLLFKFYSGLVGGYAIFLAFMISIAVEIVILHITSKIWKLRIRKKAWILGCIWLILLSSLYATFLVLLGTARFSQVQFAICLQLAGTIFAQLLILDQYNMLSARPLAHLNRMGGNTNE